MKMIKVMDEYGEEVYVNIKHILYIEKYEFKEGYSRIILFDSIVYVKGTPEEIVAIIHEAEGK